jgi:hypothetical protein
MVYVEQFDKEYAAKGGIIEEVEEETDAQELG